MNVVYKFQNCLDFRLSGFSSMLMTHSSVPMYYFLFILSHLLMLGLALMVGEGEGALGEGIANIMKLRRAR